MPLRGFVAVPQGHVPEVAPLAEEAHEAAEGEAARVVVEVRGVMHRAVLVALEHRRRLRARRGRVGSGGEEREGERMWERKQQRAHEMDAQGGGWLQRKLAQ
jgi:hypothetical protein